MKSLLRRLLDRHVYTVRRGVASGMRRRGGLGFFPQRRRTPEHRFLCQLDLRGGIAYDVGAHEGTVTLFLARAVGPDGAVVSFEPNPRSVSRLRENVALNHLSNVRVVPMGLGTKATTGLLDVPDWEPGRGSLIERPAVEGRIAQRHHGTIVRLDSLDHLLETGDLPPPSFVKIDVEGFEADVLDGMQRTLDVHRPRLMVELHGVGDAAKRMTGRRVASILRQHGYEIRHVESGAVVDGDDIPLEGHLYATPGERPVQEPTSAGADSVRSASAGTS